MLEKEFVQTSATGRQIPPSCVLDQREMPHRMTWIFNSAAQY